MQQLPLDVRLADYALFDTFFVGENPAAIHALQDTLHATERRVVWLWGHRETGNA